MNNFLITGGTKKLVRKKKFNSLIRKSTEDYLKCEFVCSESKDLICLKGGGGPNQSTACWPQTPTCAERTGTLQG